MNVDKKSTFLDSLPFFSCNQPLLLPIPWFLRPWRDDRQIRNLKVRVMYRTQIQKRRISVAFNCRDELARSIFDQSAMSPSQRRCRDTTTQIRRSYFFSWPPPFLPLVCTSFRVAKWAGKIKPVNNFNHQVYLSELPVLFKFRNFYQSNLPILFMHCKYVQWNYSGSAFKKL